MEECLPDGNWQHELDLLMNKTKTLKLSATETLAADITIDADFPDAVKEQIREHCRHKLAQATGAKVIMRGDVVIEKPVDLTGIEARLKTVEEVVAGNPGSRKPGTEGS